MGTRRAGCLDWSEHRFKGCITVRLAWKEIAQCMAEQKQCELQPHLVAGRPGVLVHAWEVDLGRKLRDVVLRRSGAAHHVEVNQAWLCCEAMICSVAITRYNGHMGRQVCLGAVRNPMPPQGSASMLVSFACCPSCTAAPPQATTNHLKAYPGTMLQCPKQSCNASQARIPHPLYAHHVELERPQVGQGGRGDHTRLKHGRTGTRAATCSAPLTRCST